MRNHFYRHGFAEQLSSLLWSFCETPHTCNFCTLWDIWIKLYILINLNIMSKNEGEGLPSIILAGPGLLVKLLVTLGPHGIF